MRNLEPIDEENAFWRSIEVVPIHDIRPSGRQVVRPSGRNMNRLETARLILRDHELSDLEAYCEMESDPVYRAPQIVHPRAELERSFRETWMPVKKMGMLATVFKEDGRYIGRTGLYPRRTDEGVIVPGEA